MSVSHGALREEVGARLFTRQRLVPIGLALLALLLVFLIAHDVFFPSAPTSAAITTVAVTRSSVRSAVSGTGTVTPVKQQAVNFAVGGTLAEVDVNVGDHVTKGQTLGRLDTTQLQQALDQANNSLTTAQAQLNATVNGNAIVQAQHSLANAQQSLADTQAQVNLTNQQDGQQLTSDTAQRDQDQTTLTNAQGAATQCHANPPQPTQQNPIPCSDKDQAVTQAQNTVNADTNKIQQDNNKIASDKLSGQRSINQANNSVTQAQDQLTSQTIQRPATIAQQQASIATAQSNVDTAQRNLNNGTLTAPFDGTVLAINSQVGDGVSGGGSSSTAASSSSTSSGGTGGTGGTGGAGSTGGGGSTSSSSSSGGFIQLGDLSGFEVMAPFAEADAARVQANQTATVTFDAVTGLTLPAHVLSVAQVATVVSNVTNYQATLVLDQVDQRLKSGMTANASVVVQNAQNVLTLPNSVISRIGGTSFVTLL
ncbi:MAG TPA: biotin/lipoyl-binding protein, partial [Candidatus Dormibacteraeota bacterium]|nr:biotin/lipoyl-binding protein [Candidatus Dormibacteraeota bacterium]